MDVSRGFVRGCVERLVSPVRLVERELLRPMGVAETEDGAVTAVGGPLTVVAGAVVGAAVMVTVPPGETTSAKKKVYRSSRSTQRVIRGVYRMELAVKGLLQLV